MAKAPILIIGAGCTGLSLAQGLTKASIPCIVFEKHPSLSPTNARDWNMGLHWGATPLSSLLPTNLWSQIHSTDVDPSTPLLDIGELAFLNGETGERIGRISVPQWHRLRRSALRDLLSIGIDIRFNKRLINFTEDKATDEITAYFSDGTSIRGSQLIGCDATHSITRSLLLGPSATNDTLHFTSTYFQSTYTRSQALHLRSFHPLYIACTHPSSKFSFFGLHSALDPSRPESWIFFCIISRLSPPSQNSHPTTLTDAEQILHSKSETSCFCDPFGSACAWLSPSTKLWTFPLTIWDPSLTSRIWDNLGGKVTLAGDAAHTMTVERGQGLNHSMQDAFELCTAITASWEGKGSRKEKIDRYEAEMRRRAGKEVRLSVVNTGMIHDLGRVETSPIMRAGLTKVDLIKEEDGSVEP